MIGLFCKKSLEKRRYSAKETFNLKEPTHCSHPIFAVSVCARTYVHVFISIFVHMDMSYVMSLVSRYAHLTPAHNIHAKETFNSKEPTHCSTPYSL